VAHTISCGVTVSTVLESAAAHSTRNIYSATIEFTTVAVRAWRFARKRN